MVPVNSNEQTEGEDMELLTLIVTILGILALLDVTALRNGTDSRDRIGDDWARPTAA
jgi:hypothetical protein